MKKKTWILVAHKRGAKVIEFTAIDDECPRIIRSIEHSEGKLKSRDIKTDRPGREMNKGTGRRYAFDVNKAPENQKEKDFAKKLAVMINTGAENNKFDQLILVAESRMLGLLHEGLKKKTISKIKQELRKDLGRLTDSSLIKRITPYATSRDRIAASSR